MRIGFLLAAVAAALALAPAASAAIARGEGREESRASDVCAGPCPTVVVLKGNGSGWVTSQPDYFGCDSNVSRYCVGEIPDVVQSVRLTVNTREGSYLQKSWEGCPNPGPTERDCTVSTQGQGAGFTLCLTISVQGAPVPDESCPPTQPPSPPAPPPPPPPATPPAVGSACTIPGSAGADVISGTAGRDVICGRGGNDTINGRGGPDLILGGAGADRLTGGAGRDSIYGGSGTDTLYARDGVRDTVNGGLGRDRARWDARDVRRSIERRL